nr:hypothetical protein Ade03nite_94570 [Actinoplanes derwentensis]
MVVWDVDGRLIPADLRWLRRAVAQTYEIDERAVTFPDNGFTDTLTSRSLSTPQLLSVSTRRIRRPV